MYNNKMFLIDKTSFSCISDISSKSIYLSIIGEKDQVKKLATNNIEDSFALSKRIDPELHENLEEKRI